MLGATGNPVKINPDLSRNGTGFKNKTTVNFYTPKVSALNELANLQRDASENGPMAVRNSLQENIMKLKSLRQVKQSTATVNSYKPCTPIKDAPQSTTKASMADNVS